MHNDYFQVPKGPALVATLSLSVDSAASGELKPTAATELFPLLRAGDGKADTVCAPARLRVGRWLGVDGCARACIVAMAGQDGREELQWSRVTDDRLASGLHVSRNATDLLVCTCVRVAHACLPSARALIDDGRWLQIYLSVLPDGTRDARVMHGTSPVVEGERCVRGRPPDWSAGGWARRSLAHAGRRFQFVAYWYARVPAAASERIDKAIFAHGSAAVSTYVCGARTRARV